jgi:two-component system response regulator NreC
VRLIALGHTTGEIAILLSVAARTVESHRQRILRKLGIRSRAELVRFALEAGLLREAIERGRRFDGPSDRPFGK